MIHLDFETRSELELRGPNSAGLDNYAKHPSTAALMLAWAIDEEPVQLWEIAKGESIPRRLLISLKDSKQELLAWNSAFERNMFLRKLGMDLPAWRWQDPQASARYLSLPASLEDVGPILGLSPEMLKDKEGDRLIGVFSELTIPRKKRAKKGEVSVQQAPYFRDWITDPEDWQRFGDYCRRDVISEREIMRRLSILKVFPLPERERRIWLLDQKINDAGIPTDREFVQKSLTIAERAKAEALEQQKKATGLDNPNSNSQMLAWVRERGFPGNSLRKEPVKIAIEDTTNELTQEARDALIARKVSSSTSYKKLSAILRQLSSDDRLKNQFIFMGSARAGRWSGNAVQFQNLARPEPQFEDLDNLDKARNLILAEDYDGIVKNFGSPLLVVKSCIRSAFVAPKGKRLNVADFSAIETRVGAWLAGCESLMDVFRQGRDPYLAFAVKMYQISYEMLDNWYHSADKEKKILVKGYRQIAKPGVLGCVYRLGPGSWGKNKYGDPIKTGLWGYAENMGIKMTQEKAQEVVRVFRESYPEIVQLWYSFENAVEKVLRGGKKAEAFVGPNDCVRFDKLNRKDQFPILRMHLPSGRCLHYVDARIEDTTMPWKRINAEGIEESVFKPTLVYSGVNQDTKQWESFVTSNGGKLCLSGDTRVVTDRGIMLLTSVTNNEKVWDGNKFVPHDGLICNGRKEVIEWNKLIATPDHQVLAGKQWRELGKMGPQNQLASQLMGLSSALQLLYHLNQENEDEPGYGVAAQENLKLILERCTKNGETVLNRGCDMRLLFRDGIASIQILIDKIMMEITNPEISLFEHESRIQIIDELLNLLNIAVRDSPMKNFADVIPRFGLRTLCAGIYQKGVVQIGVSNITGQREVFDLLNCGPNNRFTVLCDTGAILVHNCENAVQAIARDALADKMVEADEADFELVAHVHDEPVTLTYDDDFDPDHKKLEEILSRPIDWAPGLLLEADGWSGSYYHK